ncbi:hypothetical protein CAter282_2914 [Collimonas arenae]|uniref:Uncharacterized protein n=1 Tax=Collimonas arenae TaxID=279058 RepID=A0A127QKP8_9BURK|nr:hypothetical protein CAter282_2914 [Collimonas arenae]
MQPSITVRPASISVARHQQPASVCALQYSAITECMQTKKNRYLVAVFFRSNPTAIKPLPMRSSG